MKSNLYRGSLETIVLKLLNDHGQMYGYEITKQVHLITDGQIKLSEGSLYPILHKLESMGQVEIEVVEVNNRFRKYYRLTPKGCSSVSEVIEEMKEYLQIMTHIISPNPCA